MRMLAHWQQLTSAATADQAWLDTLAEFFLDACTGAALTELKSIRTSLTDLAQRFGAAPDSAGPQLRLLLIQVDSALARRSREQSRIEPGSLRHLVLEVLRGNGGSAFNETLIEQTRKRPTHISRACRELAEAGYIRRRSYGRRVEWTLAEPVRTDDVDFIGALEEPDRSNSLAADILGGRTAPDSDPLAAIAG